MHTRSIFSPTHHFPQVPVSVCVGGVLHFYHHFPEVKLLCVWGGGGAALLLFETGEGGTILSPMLNVSEVPYFPIFHLSTSLILEGGGGSIMGGLGGWGLGGMVHQSLKSEV